MVSPRRIIGVDESGKGDFFGPLVIAACLAADSQLKELSRLGVRDGKTLSDKRVLAIDVELRKVYPHAVEVITPDLYNATYKKVRNLNRLLAAAHARAIDRVLIEHEADLAIIDQFGKPELVADALLANGQGIRLEQRFRGEEVPQVAAASIMARAAFIRSLAELSESVGLELPKGAAPKVDDAGRALVAKLGPEILPKVAKLHFKNYHRVTNPALF